MIKKIPFLLILVVALVSCESSSIEEETFKAENEKPDIVDVHEDNSYGLGN